MLKAGVSRHKYQKNSIWYGGNRWYRIVYHIYFKYRNSIGNMGVLYKRRGSKIQEKGVIAENRTITYRNKKSWKHSVKPIPIAGDLYVVEGTSIGL